MTDGVNIAMNELVADGIKGPFFSTTFSRSFKDRTGAWRNAGLFSFRGLEVLMNLILPGYRASRRLPGLLKFLTELIFISELGFKEKEQNYVRRGPSQNDRATN